MRHNAQPASFKIAPVTVRQQIVDALSEAITSGHLEPGVRLIERDICERYGVSRPSVREALRQLEADGLVANIPNRGPIVASLTAEDARSIYQVRANLEGLAVRLFTLRASAGEVAAMIDAFAQLEAVYLAGDVELNLQAKNRFYSSILDHCGNRVVSELLGSLNTRVTLLRRVSLSSTNRLEESLKELRIMVAAIVRRDSQGAFEATVNHVERAGAVALKSIEQTT